MLLTGMTEWSQQHPPATLREMEEEMGERLTSWRAGMVEELVKRSPQAGWSHTPEEHRPHYEQCAKPLHSRGQHRRALHTRGGQEAEIEHSAGTCPDGGHGLFLRRTPKWGRTSSALTPRAQERWVRRPPWVPCACAPPRLESLAGVHVRKASARRLMLHAGDAAVEEWEEHTREWQRNLPAGEAQVSPQVSSAEEAMIFLWKPIDKDWRR